MRTPRSLIRTALRAAVVAVALGAAALGAAPAQAAYFGFGWGFGPFPHPYYPYYPYYPAYPRPPVYPIYPGPYIPGPVCMSNSQVRANLLSRGYYNINLYSPVGNIIRATAARSGHRYAITYNRCGGYIVNVTPLT